MADTRTKEQIEADWWAAWWAEDYSWEGLAKKPLQGWVVADGLLREAETGRVYGQAEPEAPAPVTGTPASIQDYWRADPATGRLRMDDEMGDELVAADGQPLFHCMHLAFEYKDGTQTSKTEWESNGLNYLISTRINVASEWGGDGEDSLLRIPGSRFRARFEGAIFLTGLNIDASRSFLNVDCRNAAFLKSADFVGTYFGGYSLFGGAIFLQKVDFDEANFEKVDFSEAIFTDDARFSETRFVEGASFGGATFFGDVVFDDALFDQEISLFACVFVGNASFSRATFSRSAKFSEVTFEGDATFDQVNFEADADFKGGEFLGKIDFSEAKFSGSVNFKKKKFLLAATFKKAEFSGPTKFSGAEFAEVADFSNSIFLQNAEFYGAVFLATAWFDEAKFRGNTNFEQARFAGYAGFNATFFYQIAEFNEAKFSAYAFFRGANFARVAFDAATFSEGAAFSNTQFEGDADFKDVTFSDFVSFEVANFIAQALFENADFSGGASFDSAQFWYAASFRGATFSSGTTFVATRFETGADFSSTVCDGDIYFNSSTFGFSANFDDAQFMQKTSFRLVEFQSGVQFDGASFDEDVGFGGAQIAQRFSFRRVFASGSVRFNDVRLNVSANDLSGTFDGSQFERPFDWRSLPNLPITAFDGVRFERGILLDRSNEADDVKVHHEALEAALRLRGKERQFALRALEGGALQVKRALDQATDRLREQRYYRLELLARRHQSGTPLTEKVFSIAFGFVSNYGASIGRPFVGLFALIGVFAAMFYGWDYLLDPKHLKSAGLNGVWQAFDLSWSNVFKPLSAFATENDFEDKNALAFRLLYEATADAGSGAVGRVDGTGFAVRIISTLQSLLAIVLAFLIALAVRRRFQIS